MDEYGEYVEYVDAGELPKSRFGLRDLTSESVAGLVARPARTALTALGTVLGVAALVATLGLAKTAGSQIVSRFDELAATQVTVEPASRPGGQQTQTSSIPWDAESRLTRLNGVVAAGTKSDVDVGGALVRSVPVVDPLGANEFQIPVVAVSPGLFGAVRTNLDTGRLFDAGHNDRADPVAVLGATAAARLNITRVDSRPAIFLGGETLIVIGIIDDVAREPALLGSIIVPDGWARARRNLQAPAEVIIDTDVGAAELIASQAATALDPGDEELLRVRVAGSSRAVRDKVEGDVNALFLILGGVSLLVGAIGIANVTLVSVMERRGEIGLRRAVGATRKHIAAQFLTESSALGGIAGIIGTSAGVLTVVAVSAARDWTPVLQGWLPFAAPVLGAVIGLLAGTYPAWKAASTEPITALRGGT